MLGVTNRKSGKGTPPCKIIRLTNQKAKVNVLRMGKKPKGMNLYINEHLTQAC